MAFCFALVLVQQHQSEARTAAAKQQAAYNKSHSPVSSSLKTIEPLTPITVAPPSSATAGTANPKVSAPPQPGKNSGSAVQGAAQNSNPTKPVIYEVAKPVKKTLDNLLP